MNINTLYNIITIENFNHPVEILVINENADISISNLLALGQFGNVTIVVDEPMASSNLIAKIGGGIKKNFNVVLSRKLPIRNYDILISNTLTEIIKLIINKIPIKYIGFFIDTDLNLLGNKYIKIDTNFYQLRNSISESQHINSSLIKEIKIQKNDLINYDTIIKDVGSTYRDYNKYNLDYLNPVIPGMTSIIMILNKTANPTDKWNTVLMSMKEQNIENIEFIVIDNGFSCINPRNKENVITMKYTEAKPEDFCIRRAKELSSGEYIMIMNQDSDEFDIILAIHTGKYETR